MNEALECVLYLIHVKCVCFIVPRVLISEASRSITFGIFSHFKDQNLFSRGATEDRLLDFQTLEMHQGNFVFVFKVLPWGRY